MLSLLLSWEGLAVLLGIAYLLLALRESIWCWYAAFASTLIFLGVFWQSRLLMESTLQVYYLGMAVYGWWQWRGGTDGDHNTRIHRWTWRQHLVAWSAILAASALSGALLSRHTDAALPYLDSFTTWGAVLTTWMVARKVLENWLYWLVVDGASIALYLQLELYLTAALFALYLAIVCGGYATWLRRYQRQV
jgi:nicotinamide mononucleotide transporter